MGFHATTTGDPADLFQIILYLLRRSYAHVYTLIISSEVGKHWGENWSELTLFPARQRGSGADIQPVADRAALPPGSAKVWDPGRAGAVPVQPQGDFFFRIQWLRARPLTGLNSSTRSKA